MFYKVLEGNI